MPELIQKRFPTRPLKILPARDRKKELENAYTLNKKLPTPHPKIFLLIDDTITTWTTMQAIVDLLRFHFPGTEILVLPSLKPHMKYISILP